MNTTNKHIGNILSNMTDKDLFEVLEQYTKKKFENKESMLQYLAIVINCEHFCYDGEMDENYDTKSFSQSEGSDI